MLETLTTTISVLNSLTPLGLCAGLAFIIWQFASKKGSVRLISENHLSGLPDMAHTLVQLVDSNKRLEATLLEIRDGLNYLKGRLNGR